MKNTIQIYENEGHQVEVRLDGEHNTVWLSQAQMVDLFERDQSVISRHVRNVFKEEELEGESNMQKMHIANSDKPVAFYSLDVIISVGYRVKSPQGVRFRQWATQRLKEYLVQGYTLNQQRFDKNAEEMTTNVQVVDVRHERREESRCVANEDERGKEQYNGFRELPVHECLVIALGDQATGYRSIKKRLEQSVALQVGRPGGHSGQYTLPHHPGFLMPYAAI